MKKQNFKDKLSDRLHEELTKTFIDKRATCLPELKQDMEFDTKILKIMVMIDDQFMEKLMV